MHWPTGPFGRHDNLVPHHRRHEPFTPRIPALFTQHPGLIGGVMAVVGFTGNWWVADQLQHWPSWSLFPGVLISVLCLISMVIGLGLIVIRALEPLLANKEFGWDAEPLAVFAIPPTLQRKCEALGFWAADDVVQAIEKGKFPWTSLAYDERMQLERAAHRWSAAMASQQKAKKAHGRRRTAGQSGD